jgi:acyl carrier protein
MTDTLQTIIGRILGISETKITDSLKRESIEQWDSFNHLMLVSELEKEFKVKFTTQEIEMIKTIRDIRKLIYQKKKQ